MTQVHSVDMAHKVEHRWERRPRAGVSPMAQNDNHVGDGLCPVCKGYASIGPLSAEYCGSGLVRRHWECRACGHEWITVLHVLT